MDEEARAAMLVHRRRLTRPRVVLIGTPTAGADWAYTFAENGILQSILFHFAASATVANRQINAVVKGQNGTMLARAPLSANITASNGADCSWYPGAVEQALGSASMAPLPALEFNEGWIVGSLVQNIQTGDAFTNVAISYLALPD